MRWAARTRIKPMSDKSQGMKINPLPPVLAEFDDGSRWELSGFSGGAAPEGTMGLLHLRHINKDGNEIQHSFLRLDKLEHAPKTVPFSDDFQQALAHAINANSRDNGSNTPDFILAEFLDQV